MMLIKYYIDNFGSGRIAAKGLGLKETPVYAFQGAGVARYLLIPKDAIYATTPNTKADIQISIPPCSGFSTLSTNSITSKTKNALSIMAIEEFINSGSRFLIFETVPGFLKSEELETIKEMLKGYCVKVIVDNYLNHGIPQNRKRVFLLAGKKDFEFKPFTSPKIDLVDYLKDVNHKFDFELRTVRKEEWKDFLFRDGWVDYFRQNCRGEIIKPLYKLWLKDKSIVNGHKYLQEIMATVHKKRQSGHGVMLNGPVIVNEHTNTLAGHRASAIVHPVENRFIYLSELLKLMGLKDYPGEIRRADAGGYLLGRDCWSIFRTCSPKVLRNYIKFAMGVL